MFDPAQQHPQHIDNDVNNLLTILSTQRKAGTPEEEEFVAEHILPLENHPHTTQFNQAALAYYTDGSGDTARDRVLKLPGILGFEPLPTLAAGEAVLVQMTREVVDWAEVPEFATPRLIEWASGDGMTGHFKVMAVGAPRVKSHYDGKSGIVHATSA